MENLYTILTASMALILGLGLLVWSADRFVEGAAATARHFGMPSLLIGMLIVGFGTSAPEMVVSAFAALDGSPGIALGNAYGSNIANIALILGITGLLSPIMVHSSVLRKELPLLSLVTLFSFFLVQDLIISRLDALLLLIVFFIFMGWTIRNGLKNPDPILIQETKELNTEKKIPIKKAFFWLFAGLILLILSSRMLVWGAVNIAQIFGVSDLIIGLTIVAIGTSLPELASSIAAARKGEHDIALGNVIGSNMFNTLAVVGIAGSIHPFAVEQAMLTRDMPVMGALTLSLFVFGFGFKGRQGRINRFEAGALLVCYVVYTAILIKVMI